MENKRELGLLKFKLFFYGVNIDASTLETLNSKGYRVPAIIRTGASYGIESIVNNSLYVNIPINKESPIHMVETLDTLIMDDNSTCAIKILKHPISVSLEKNGVLIENVGKICFDRLGITLYSGCSFKEKNKGCKFCGIDNAPSFNTHYLMDSDDLVFVLKTAFDVPNNEIKHILLSGGVLPGEEYGAAIFAEAAQTIKTINPKLSVSAMLPPPEKDSTLQMLITAGIDEISINLEIMDRDYRQRLIPGKEEIGMDRYFKALEYLSNHLPKFGARSILMGGIEPLESTLNGVEELCKRGVMPIISHYRTLGVRLPSFVANEEDMYDLWESASNIADKYGMVIGPTCIPCQSNVIALPVGDNFRYY